MCQANDAIPVQRGGAQASVFPLHSFCLASQGRSSVLPDQCSPKQQRSSALLVQCTALPSSRFSAWIQAPAQPHKK